MQLPDARRAAALRTYLACLAYGAVGMTNTVFGAALTPVAHEYGVSLPTAGSLVALQFGGFVLAGPLAGQVADRVGNRRVIPLGFALMIAGLGMFGLVTWWPLALAAALLLGLGFGVCGATINSYVVGLNPARRGWAVGLVQFAFGAGSVLSPFVAAGLLAGGRSWRLLFALDAGLGLAALALFVALLRAEPAVRRVSMPRQKPFLGWSAVGSRQSAESLATADCRLPTATSDEHRSHLSRLARQMRGLARSTLAWLALAQALYMGVQAGLTTWLAPYIQRSLGAAPALAALGGTVLWLGLTGGRLLSSQLGERLGYARLALAGALAGLALLLVLLALPSGELVLAGALVLGFAYGPCFPMILASGSRAAPERPGAATGVILGVGSLGAVLFPWLAGQAGAANQTLPLVVLAGVGVFLLAVTAWINHSNPA